MDRRTSACQGGLLGLAVGDAMGYAVDEKTWEEIRENYGPNGLLGYDLVNDCATGSACTQVAAYVANGLLLGITRGKQERYVPLIHLSLREWARAQYFTRDPERSWCWTAKLPQLRGKKCKDIRMLDALQAETPGEPDRPANRSDAPGGLPGAVAVGLACGGKGISRGLAVALGAHTLALTHGDPQSFLCGSVLAESIAAIAEDGTAPLQEQFLSAIGRMLERYGQRYCQAEELAQYLQQVVEKTRSPQEDPRQVMEQLGCDTARQCLAGAMYAACVWQSDFDSAMILAVNHSGRSATVGCLTGAILGTKMGVEALPEFYLESLELAAVLTVLANDLSIGSPTVGLFDIEWDHKYVQGMVPAGIGNG